MNCGNERCNVKLGAGQRKFCSRSCAAKVNNQKYPKRGPGELRLCAICGTEFKGGPKRKYCSRSCFDVRSQGYIQRWLSGDESGSTSSGEISSIVRKYLIAASGNRCTSPDCYVPGGWGTPNSKSGKVILSIDHIDGDWKNNSVGNLVLLCYNCHTLTPTFGSLNRGKGLSERSVGSRRH